MEDKFLFILIFSGIWSLLGAIFFIIGIGLKSNLKKKEQNCTAVTYGKVRDIVRHHDSKGHSSWHPVFEYYIDDLEFIKESPYGSSSTKYAVGQEVKIKYNPKNHHEYYIVGDTLPKMLGNIFMFIGLGMAAIAVIVAVIVLFAF